MATGNLVDVDLDGALGLLPAELGGVLVALDVLVVLGELVGGGVLFLPVPPEVDGALVGAAAFVVFGWPVCAAL